MPLRFNQYYVLKKCGMLRGSSSARLLILVLYLFHGLFAGIGKCINMEREDRGMCAAVARTCASLCTVRENADGVCVLAHKASSAVPTTA